MTNKHGLSRRIPADVRKGVRRRCGFGCVICGDAIITYEHFDPPFEDARKHDPRGITLLCGSHQIESTKGLLSKDTISAANADPYCKRLGHATHVFDLGGQRPTLVLGTTKLQAIGDLLRLNGSPILQVHAPEPKSSRWRLSALFPAKDGRMCCRIVENELQVNSGNFDFVQEAKRFVVRDGEQSEMLRMEIEPLLELRILKFRWSVGGLSVEIVDRCPKCSGAGAPCVCSIANPAEGKGARRGWFVASGPTFSWTSEHCGFYSATSGLQITDKGLVLGGGP